MARAIFSAVVLVGMLAFFMWGLLNPGRIKWKYSPVPVSPMALVGAVIFSGTLGLLVVIERVDLIHDDKAMNVIIWVMIGLAVSGWGLALIAGKKDMRGYRQSRPRKEDGSIDRRS